MRNELKRMKNQFYDFLIFIFWAMVIFVLKKLQFSMNLHDNSKNRNFFLFYSAHCASFVKTGAKLRGRGSAYPHLGNTRYGGGAPHKKKSTFCLFRNCLVGILVCSTLDLTTLCLSRLCPTTEEKEIAFTHKYRGRTEISIWQYTLFPMRTMHGRCII